MPASRIYPTVVITGSGGGTDHAAEIEALNLAVSNLTNNLSAESQSRTQGDQALQSSLNLVNFGLSNEVQARQNADESLQDQIDNLPPQTSLVFERERVTITSQVLTDLVISLNHTPLANSIEVEIISGPELYALEDFELSGSDLTLLASSPLVAMLGPGDEIEITYSR